MKFIVSLLKSRNLVLIIAVILGLLIGDYAHYLKNFTVYILALVMAFSMTNISTKSLYPLSKLIKPALVGALLNYFIYAAIMITCAWLLIDDRELFYGFIIIATTPPGVAIIPFSTILKGDVEYAIKGVLGAFLCTIFFTPFLVGFFTREDGISSTSLFLLMVKTIIIPLVISRLLLIHPIDKGIKKIQGKVVDYGFACLIFIAVGVNRTVFFEQTNILLGIAIVLFISHFVVGYAHEKLIGKWTKNEALLISDNLLLTIKSSGFAVVTALQLFGQKAAIPTAVLPIFVLIYLIFLSVRKG